MRTIFAILVVLVLTRTAALSCSCGPRGTPAAAFAQADAVFVGRCIAGKIVIKHDQYGDSDECRFTFEVTRSWKGLGDKKKVTVDTLLGDGDCGYVFQIGANYVVYCYTSAKGDGLYTNVCTCTNTIDVEDRLDAEMKELDVAKRSAAVDSAPRRRPK